TGGRALTRDHSVLPRACCGKLSASLIHDIRSSVQIWSAGGNDFGLIESGNSDIDFISIGLAHESQCAATHPAERAEAPDPFNFARFAIGQLKIVPLKRSPGRKRRAGTLATIFAMAMGDVVGLADAFVSNSATQATAANGLWLRFHH